MKTLISYEPTITHFSHPHALQLHYSDHHLPNAPPCACCKSPPSSSSPIYTCTKRAGCCFLLHAWCAMQPQLITHPSHVAHPLNLLPVPAYPTGYFKCNGCGLPGDGFSFRCSKDCNFDLHVTCAAKPLRVSHVSHRHELGLSFTPPYSSKRFSCNICGGVGENQWLYRCGSCNFDAHLWCATAAGVQPPVMMSQHDQYHRSYYGYSAPAAVAGTTVANYNKPAVGAAASYGAPVYVVGQVVGGCTQAVIGNLLWG